VENKLFANIKNICWWEWQGQKTWWVIFLQSCTSCWSCSSLKRRNKTCTKVLITIQQQHQTKLRVGTILYHLPAV
jgi:hypothetical protein